MNSSSWVQIIGYVIIVLGSCFTAYVVVRSTISRLEAAVQGLQANIDIKFEELQRMNEAETRRIEKLLEVQVGRLDQLIASGQREREEHNARIRFLEQRLMEEIAARR